MCKGKSEVKYSMIYFYDDLVEKTMKIIKESHDCADIVKDLNRINQTITNINLYEDYSVAVQLNRELRQKYPCINSMVNFANSITIQTPRPKMIYSPNESVLLNLKQDYYGILCDTAIKKHLVHSIKEFIKNVD